MQIPTYIQGQLERELDRSYERYSKDQVDSLVDKLKREYQIQIDNLHQENISLKFQIESLKKESDIIWKMGIEKLVEEKLKVRDLEERWGKLLGDK